MPKKENSAGEMQNYSPETGRYEGGVSGGGESKKESGSTDKKLSSFKKQPSEFEKANAKRTGKKSKVEDWQISEALADFQWQVTQETTVGQYAQETANRLGIDKEDVLKVMRQENGSENMQEDEKLAKYLYPEDYEEEEEVDQEIVKTADKIRSSGDSYTYQMLDRLRMDVEYVLANRGAINSLWYDGNPTKHIALMKELHNGLKEKPEWLTMDKINEYEKRFKELED